MMAARCDKQSGAALNNLLFGEAGAFARRFRLGSFLKSRISSRIDVCVRIEQRGRDASISFFSSDQQRQISRQKIGVGPRFDERQCNFVLAVFDRADERGCAVRRNVGIDSGGNEQQRQFRVLVVHRIPKMVIAHFHTPGDRVADKLHATIVNCLRLFHHLLRPRFAA